MRLILLLTTLIGFTSTYANAPFYGDSPKGFLWYQIEKPIEIEEKKAQDKPQVSFTEMMEARQKEGKELLSRMQVLKTPESAEAWLKWESMAWDESEEIGLLTEYVKKYRNPSLNYELTHPTSQVAYEVYEAKERQKRVKDVKRFANTHGLLFFFQSKCQYCTVMAPIIQQVASQYNIDVLGISLDGERIPGIQSEIDSGLAAQLMGENVVTPAVFALNPKTGDLFPVVYGAVSALQLEEQIMSAVEYADLYPELVKQKNTLGEK